MTDIQKEEHLNKAKRPERVPLIKQKSMTASERPGYTRRWVNEVVDRVDAFMRAGWLPVVGKDSNTSDKLAQTESQLGSVIRKVVNKDPNASCRTAILMEIPTELFEQDQKDKQKINDETEKSYNPEFQSGADYGSMKYE